MVVPPTGLLASLTPVLLLFPLDWPLSSKTAPPNMSLEPALSGEPAAGGEADEPDAMLVVPTLFVWLLVGENDVAAKPELLLRRCLFSLLKGERTIGRRAKEEKRCCLMSK